MGKKKFLVFLFVEALCCAVWQLSGFSGRLGISSFFAFPFEQIGDGLRTLSLSGTAGNVAAILLYILFCGCPMLVLLALHVKRKAHPEDGLLAGLSVLLFFAMYLMINPGLMTDVMGGYMGAGDSGKLTLGAVIYSVLAGYLVLHILRRIFGADMEQMQKYFKLILYILGAVFVWAAFGVCLGELQSGLKALAESNTADSSSLFIGMGGAGSSMSLSRAFLVIRYAVDALPYLLDTVIVLTGLDSLDALKADRYGEKTIGLAQKLSSRCGVMLAAVVLCNMGFNVLQLVFADKLLVIDGTVALPMITILFVLVVLFLARLLTENKELKEDNDLFV